MLSQRSSDDPHPLQDPDLTLTVAPRAAVPGEVAAPPTEPVRGGAADGVSDGSISKKKERDASRAAEGPIFQANTTARLAVADGTMLLSTSYVITTYCRTIRGKSRRVEAL